MAPRRSARLTRRRRRLLRLARTVTVTVVLVTGGVWWAGDEDAADAPPAAGPVASGGAGPVAAAGAPAGAAAGAPAALDHKAKPRARPKPVPPPRPSPPPAPLARSVPTAVAVPAITIEAPVTRLGLDAEGRLATPPVDDPRVVGWYAKGATPGERGTAVVVGHRDTRSGPAVFLNLDSLSPGNTVRVARADGRVAVFTVDRVRTYAKTDFPDKEVYGSTGRPELRLLTCGGAFDRKTGYEANIVVFAHLTDIAQKI
ncbi:class F sortase [Streptomyces venezuelae]|uniref:class F sortase n=6 Tax=Streptomyces TaxID=1883 RepID=UPI00090201F8|nr:class F sortase [Streptomyces venezuelae]QER98079.1 class F sortase [Streptomyces venezuelae ATCC 10712]QES05278.1 class F sortase [Streptomyces venezuelae]